MHTTEKFKCEICQEKCASSNALKKHGESHVAHIVGEVVDGGQVGIDGNDSVGIRDHKEDSQSENEASSLCYYCEKKVTKKNMWRHIEEVHDKTRINTDKIDVTSYSYDCE